MSDKNAAIAELDKAIQSFQTQIDETQKQIDAIKAARDSVANNPSLESLYNMHNNTLTALEAQKQAIVKAQDAIKAQKDKLQGNNMVYVLITILIILCLCSSSVLAAFLIYMYNK